jgi:glycerate 2-kinase
MKVLLAPDKFKGSLSAAEVCNAIARGLQWINPSMTIISMPMADGGEGTYELLTTHSKGTIVTCRVSDPLFRKIIASYGTSGDGSTAFIEMASASGLQLLKPEERNPLKTTTYGTGELIADAIKRGVKKIVLAIGGSATNDAGIGMAAALGIKFLDTHGKSLDPIGENLIHLHFILDDNFLLNQKSIEVILLCDVDNELYGAQGAAYVYGAQKGADDHAIQLLDSGLRNFAGVVNAQLKLNPDFPGAGAAGGLGAGAKVFLNATFSRGIEYMLNVMRLEDEIMRADLVITGEGRMDTQTLSGKVVMGVTQLANKHQKPVIALAGINELSEENILALGVQKVIALVNEKTSAVDAMANASELISNRVYENLKEDQSFFTKR